MCRRGTTLAGLYTIHHIIHKTHTHTHTHTHRLSSVFDSWSPNHFLTSASGPVWSSTLYITLVWDSATLMHNESHPQTQSESGKREEGIGGQILKSHLTSHTSPPLPTRPNSTPSSSTLLPLYEYHCRSWQQLEGGHFGPNSKFSEME